MDGIIENDQVLVGSFSAVVNVSTVDIDSTLTAEGKAADAKATGEAIQRVDDAAQKAYRELEEPVLALADRVETLEQSTITDPSLSEEGKAAEAKAVGKKLAELANELQSLSGHVEDLHYKPIDITSCSVSPSVAEMGSTVNTVTVSWATNKVPASQTVDGESVAVSTRSKQLSGLSVTADKSFTVRAKDERSAEDSASATIRFYNGVYGGALDVDAVINSAAVLGMTKYLQSGKAKTFTATAKAGQKFAYALPTRYGTPAFNVGGFDYIWTKAASFDFTNASGYTEQYDVWLNDEVVVGTRTIKVT